MSDRSWSEIARYAAACPSPHNTQPFRLRVSSENTAEVVFLPRRGLPVADPEGRFTWLTAGIFVEICRIAAHGLGFELTCEPLFEPMYRHGDRTTPQVIATLKLLRAPAPIADLDRQLILDRQTSRLPYDGRPVAPEVIGELQEEALRGSHKLEVRTDANSIRWVIELNREALFHDMENEPIRNELVNWLRFGAREEAITQDGLSSRCLGFSARVMRSFFTRPSFWTFPPVKAVIGPLYKRSMTGVGTIGWLRGPYRTRQDWFAAGKTMIRLWLLVTRHGYHWHPYGSIITSESARANMIRYFEMPDEKGGDDMVWLLLRLGRSAVPPRSHRLPVDEVMLCSA